MSGEKQELTEVYACSECGCEDVEGESWVHLNTNTPTDSCENDECWCPNCNDHVLICSVVVGDSERKCTFGCVDPVPVFVAKVDEERPPAKVTDDGYELRTHAGEDIVLSKDKKLCPSCEGDGREWVWGVKPTSGHYSENGIKCRRCEGSGKVAKEDWER